eukprot:5199039-Pleurochrysis_carterae.AAC.1
MAMSTAEPNACSPLRHRLSSAAAESAVAAEARREEQLRTGDFADEFHPLDTRPLLMSRLHKARARPTHARDRGHVRCARACTRAHAPTSTLARPRARARMHTLAHACTRSRTPAHVRARLHGGA